MCKRNMNKSMTIKEWLIDCGASAEAMFAVEAVLVNKENDELKTRIEQLEAELSKMANHVDELLKPPVNDDVVAGSAKHLALDWHNPMKLDSPGEGFRFLLKAESRTNATHFFGYMTRTWREMSDDSKIGELNKHVTYRTNKPIPDDID